MNKLLNQWLLNSKEKILTKMRRPIQADEEEILKPSKLMWRSFKRDKAAVLGSVLVLFILFISVFTPLLAPRDPLEMIPENRFSPPSKGYLLGSDRFGRDQLSRVMYGARVSMLISSGSVTMAIAIGLIIGLISGYYGGKLDQIIMRCLDIVFAFPVILLALVVIAIAGPSLLNLLFTIGFIYSARIARVTRGSVLSIKQKDYVEAAKSMGARDATIIFYYILPNSLAPIIVQATFFLALAIQVEASLSFLGLGTQPPTPSLGLMLNESRRFMEVAPWLAVFPGLAIVFAVLAFNLVGDGLRNAFDPRLSQR